MKKNHVRSIVTFNVQSIGHKNKTMIYLLSFFFLCIITGMLAMLVRPLSLERLLPGQRLVMFIPLVLLLFTFIYLLLTIRGYYALHLILSIGFFIVSLPAVNYCYARCSRRKMVYALFTVLNLLIANLFLYLTLFLIFVYR